jgi:hypothetical protein
MRRPVWADGEMRPRGRGPPARMGTRTRLVLMDMARPREQELASVRTGAWTRLVLMDVARPRGWELASTRTRPIYPRGNF